MVVGIVARGADLLDDHLLLTVELVLLEQRVLQNVGEDVCRQRHVFLQHAGEIAGVLHRGGSVEVATDILDGFGDLERGAGRGALERHMFEDMRNAMLGEGFRARAGFHPDAEGCALEMRHVIGDDGHAVIEGGGLYAQTNSSPPGIAAG